LRSFFFFLLAYFLLTAVVVSSVSSLATIFFFLLAYLLLTAVSTTQTLHGETSLLAAMAMSNLGSVMVQLKELEQAETWYSAALETERVWLAPDAPPLLALLKNFGDLLERMERPRDAEKLAKEVRSRRCFLGAFPTSCESRRFDAREFARAFCLGFSFLFIIINFFDFFPAYSRFFKESRGPTTPARSWRLSWTA